MDDEAKGEKSKLFIDEDWKSQVQAEKEALRQRQSHGQSAVPPAGSPASGAAPSAASSADSGSAAAGAASAAGEIPPLPPASIETLITSLVTQATICLGQAPPEPGGQPILDLEQAKYVIDMLQVIDEKTRGNLSPNEQALLTAVLHQLRLAFVQIRDHVLNELKRGSGPQGGPCLGA